MIFTNKNDDELIVTCKCGCGSGLYWQAGVLDEKGKEYYLTLIEASWYARQEGRLKSYFKRLWKSLRGKEYCLTETILKKSEVEEFAAFLNRLTVKFTEGGSHDGDD